MTTCPDWGASVLMDDVFTAEQCEVLIHNAENELMLPASMAQGVGDYRRSNVTWLTDKRSWSWVYDAICPRVRDYNAQVWRFELMHPEAAQFTRYTSEQSGHYDWHTDNFGGAPHGHRKLSISVQLTDPNKYDGGDLELNGSIPFTVPKAQGGGVIFPSYLPHRVSPVTRGCRHSLVMWILGAPFK